MNIKAPRDLISDREAWALFRIAAIAEAISWMLLLVGMLIRYVLIPGDNTWVAIGGSIHGIIFLAYFAAALGLARVLHLTLWQAVEALFVSIIPFGTLVFVHWLAKRREATTKGSFRQVVVRAIISNKKGLLAIQPQDTNFWCLPGGVIGPSETPEAALLRTIEQQTGVAPEVGELVRVFQYTHHSVERLELFFNIKNVSDYTKPKPSLDLDDISFVSLDGSIDLKPDFLLKNTPPF